jgi:hypothetical protein
MSLIKTLFHLTGAHAGKTIRLGKYQFTDGKCELSCPAHEMALHARSLERNWSAYPEGHPILTKQDNGNGTGEVPPGSTVTTGDANVQGDVQQDGSAAGEAAAGSGDDADAASGTAGDQAAGADGPEASVTPVNTKLQKAVMSLDPNNDEHWTQDGKPAISAVQTAYGSADVTRADVTAVAPDFNRATAAKPAE